MIRAWAALAGLALAGASAAAPPGWIGRYVYEQSLGRDLSGTTTPFIMHSLTLATRACLLTAEGFQTFDRMRCTAVPSAGGIAIRFLRYDDAGGANPRKHPYRNGETLFVLARSKGAMRTVWRGYAVAPAGPKAGRYFTRR